MALLQQFSNLFRIKIVQTATATSKNYSPYKSFTFIIKSNLCYICVFRPSQCVISMTGLL